MSFIIPPQFLRSKSRHSLEKSKESQFVRECFLRERLHQVLVGAGIQGGSHLLEFRFGSHHENPYGCVSRLAPNPLHELQAGHIRHVPIHQQERGQRLLGAQRRERVGSATGFGDFEPNSLKLLRSSMRIARESSTTIARIGCLPPHVPIVRSEPPEVAPSLSKVSGSPPRSEISAPAEERPYSAYRHYYCDFLTNLLLFSSTQLSIVYPHFIVVFAIESAFRPPDMIISSLVAPPAQVLNGRGPRAESGAAGNRFRALRRTPACKIRMCIREFLVESMKTSLAWIRNSSNPGKRPKDAALLGSIFRTFHTIKGTCGFLAFSTLEKVTHHAESILSQLRDGNGN